MFNKIKKLSITKHKYNLFEISWFICFSLLSSILPWFFITNTSENNLQYILIFLSCTSTIFGLIGSLTQLKKIKHSAIYNIFSFLLTGIVLWFQGAIFIPITNWFIMIPIYIYGFFNWMKEENQYIEIKSLNKKQKIITFTSTFLIGIILSVILASTTSSYGEYTIWFDSFIAVIMTAGTILLNMKYKESMKLFIFVNFLYLIYTLLQIIGIGMNSSIELIPIFIMYIGFLSITIYTNIKW